MGFAMEMNLDAEAAGRVREVWSALAARGITSEMVDIGATPHVSLAVFDQVDAERLRPIIESFATRLSGLELSVASIGTFATSEGVVFAAPVVTSQLLDLHAQLHEELDALGSSRWEIYLPGRWVPHCTLALGVDAARVSEAIEIARRSGVSGTMRVTELALVEFRPVREIYSAPVPRTSTPS